MISTENHGQPGGQPLCIRALHIHDLPRMLALQSGVYSPELLESEAVLASKIRATPPGWISLAAVHGDTLCAYALACPWRSDAIPRWNHSLTPQHDCDVIYLHDVAVDHAYAGRGIARKMVSQLLQQGRRFGLARAVLIAVDGAQGYWSRLGFVASDSSPTDPAFGDGAVLMLRDLNRSDPAMAGDSAIAGDPADLLDYAHSIGPAISSDV